MKWYQRLFRLPELWLLTVAALFTRVWQLGQPSAVVFDEVYFRAFAGDYLNGNYFFDIHPPLIKLLFAGVANLLHIQPEQLIGNDPAGTTLRIIPALAGVALVPLVYIIVRQLGLGRRVALIGGLLVLLDNALLVESRFVLMDSMLLLAGFGALSSYLALRRTSGLARWVWLVPTVALLGVTVSIKWTGLAIVGLVGIAWLVDAVMYRRRLWVQSIIETAVAVVVIAAIYIGSFAIHFALLTHSGEGDAFMSQKFQSTLIGSPHYDPATKMALWDKIVELNKEMYAAQSTLKNVEHPYASRWYSWPFEIRPIYYWQGEPRPDGVQGNIYLLGNPVVWWLSAVSVLAALLIWLVRPRLLVPRQRLTAFLLAGYGLNFIPFAFIDRPMFLYHYLFALLFAILLTCVMLSRLFDWQRQKYGAKAVSQTFWALVVALLLGFLYFLPLSYGWPLSSPDLVQRIWLPTWR